MESSGSSKSTKKKKTGPIIKDMVEFTNMCTTQTDSELPIVTHYKKKINDLSMNNKALSQALETSHRTIYHQNKVISNLEKKLVSEVPEVVLFKFQAIGTALKHVVDLVEEASILLKSKAAPNSMQADANSHSPAAASIRPCQKKSKHHLKRKMSSPKGATDQAFPVDLENGTCSYSSSEEEIDELIAQFKSDKNVRHKRKKCKRSTSKRGDKEMLSFNSENLPHFRSQALGTRSSSYPIDTPDTDSIGQDLLLKISSKSNSSNRPSASEPCTYIDSSQKVKHNSRSRSLAIKSSRSSSFRNRITKKSKSSMRNRHENGNSHSRFVSSSKPPKRTSARNISHSPTPTLNKGNVRELRKKQKHINYGDTDDPNSPFNDSLKPPTRTRTRNMSQSPTPSTSKENVRELRKKQAHINYDDADDLNFIFEEDEGKAVTDTGVDLKIKIKLEPEEVIDNVKISDIQSITSEVPLLQPQILVKDIFLVPDSDCDSIILKSKSEYLSQKENKCQALDKYDDAINNNDKTSLEIQNGETIETSVMPVEEKDKVLPPNGEDNNGPSSDVVKKIMLWESTNIVSDFPSLGMHGTASEVESKTSIEERVPNVAIKKGTSAESTEEFSNSDDDDLNWKEVFDCILKE